MKKKNVKRCNTIILNLYSVTLITEVYTNNNTVFNYYYYVYIYLKF